ncbi:MAG: cytochrome c oxidase assembly protein [Chloroflexota bacterium]
MHPILSALLSGWEWRPEVIAVLALFGFLYTTGWWHLYTLHRTKQKHPQKKLATIGKLVCYLSGLMILATSLLSPIDMLGGQLFFMHMIQHLLTIMVAAPLIWLAHPFPISLWGLPRPLRLAVAGLMHKNALFRRGLAAITGPGPSWVIFIVVYLGWHDSTLYNLALRRDWVHDIQHITFFGAGMLYWWHVIGAAPRIHGPFSRWARMAFLIVTVPPNMIAGTTISFATEPIYTYYATIPRFWGFTVMQDQMLGGTIMWILGSMMYIMAALVILAVYLSNSAKRDESIDISSHRPTMPISPSASDVSSSVTVS